MGRNLPRRVVEPASSGLAFDLPDLGRKRPRAYEEWRALKRWGRLPRQEESLPGFLLRHAREAADLSQQQLADRLGCSQQAVSQAERWQSNPTVGLMEAWARATGCQLSLELRNRRDSVDPYRTKMVPFAG